MKISTFDYVRLAARSFALTLGICALVIGTFGTGIALANNPTPGVCSHSVCSVGCTVGPRAGTCVGGCVPNNNNKDWCIKNCDKGCKPTAIPTICECQGNFVQ